MSVPVAVWNKIEALEQAHAELAAKMEQMISKAGTDCDLCEGRGWNINVPSQSMYPCMWCGGKGKVNIASLESPAPAPDPVCTCGKPKSAHGSGCLKFESADERWVDTTVPTAEPEPAPLDPVLMTAIRKWGTLMNKVGYLCGQDKPSGYESNLCNEAYDAMEAAIRAYGRDGAR